MTTESSFKKYMPNMTCAITGDVSDDNLRLIDGKLILSEDGAKKLVDEITERLGQKQHV